jgi:group I intron endonuclease
MKSGIYEIENTKTGKKYIGQSKNIEKRIRTHKSDLRNGTHINKEMQFEYMLEKNDNLFKFKILELLSVEKLNEKEKEYILKSKENCYNFGNSGNKKNYNSYKISTKKFGILIEKIMNSEIVYFEELKEIGFEENQLFKFIIDWQKFLIDKFHKFVLICGNNGDLFFVLSDI